ncbi:UDP-forming cellulose synthase catalytic subunit [Pseudomonas sp. S 311-6]|uniref:UDP-forming cellulose synthase catalytic subunit n=1 Tax=Kerstersia gyiorum TaxID=206506 RepID=UPI002097D01C|nr:UDP-forming cellulose synthase catalytic subunit [Pseudomonas sp. S 311-6]
MNATPSSHDKPSTPSLADRLSAWGERAADLPLWNSRPVRYAIVALSVFLFYLVITVPLSLGQQAFFAVASITLSLLLRRVPGRIALFAMIMLSIAASLRYMYWRLTSTLGFEHILDIIFGFTLLIAELYALVTLLLGYFQSAWPLHRKPVPLPDDVSQWPTVDIFIPTYNEPLAIVRQTVFNAMALDWPRDKIKIYVLDDGRREEFREFCAEAGVTHVTRNNNFHAKAGNINAALEHTTGDYIAIFDCDHIPTRSFLQITMGWFLKDPKLSMIQTPHVFYSPDPFERNLQTFRVTPNEGELFYGLLQDGNDLWNATFFCGSCAVIKRAPLLEVGGIAVETVTEDAHTALKMQRLGYNTAYLGIPQAAGLATESLSGHIGQRIRWARGMAQIFRMDCPLLGKGLKLAQRLCYTNAALHFFYGLPRLIFLTAPLAYLLFGIHVFNASALMITAYAVPHILLATVTNSQVQGKFRHSFWNEVYESVLAWYILRPVLVAFFIDPKLGKFNVTAKGGVIDKAYFDWTMAKPYLVLLALNLLGVGFGVYHLVTGASFAEHGVTATLTINLFWIVYNTLLLAACVAAASETRQVRESHRVSMRIKSMLKLASGGTIACETVDFSQGGLGIRLPDDVDVPLHERLMVSIYRNDEEATLPAKVVFSRGRNIGLQFVDLTPQQEVEFARMTFARADIWTTFWGKLKRDKPLSSLASLLRVSMRGIVLLFIHSKNMLVDLVKGNRVETKRTKLETGD